MMKIDDHDDSLDRLFALAAIDKTFTRMGCCNACYEYERNCDMHKELDLTRA